MSFIRRRRSVGSRVVAEQVVIIVVGVPEANSVEAGVMAIAVLAIGIATQEAVAFVVAIVIVSPPAPAWLPRLQVARSH